MRRPAPRLRWRTLVRAGVPLLSLLLLTTGCGLLPPDPKTTQADSIYLLYLVVFGMGAAVFVGVEGFIVYSVIRYRRRDDRLPVQHHGNTRVEIVWTAIPSVIVMVLFVASLLTLNQIQARSDQPAVTIEVQGFQWQWTFTYPEGYSVTGDAVDPPVMVVPVGEPVRLVLTSHDVIHSFFVPAFLVKLDVVPFPEGQPPNELEFTVKEPGTYRGQCAEFCGLHHAQMTFTVQAMAPDAFRQWLADAVAGVTPIPSASIPPSGTVIRLSASQLKFSTDRIEVPAGEPFVIEFANNEAVQHNVAILDGTTPLFEGAKFEGPQTVIYSVPALPAGDYRFLCQVHPGLMFGTLVAR